MQIGESSTQGATGGGQASSDGPRSPTDRRFNVWAPHTDFAVAWSGGNGWNMLLEPFSGTSDLLSKLRSRRFAESGWPWAAELDIRGRVRKLGIMAHGDPGEVRVGPVISSEVFARRPQIRAHWQQIGTEFVTPNGMIAFFSCTVAAGREGTDFLKELSNLWPGRTVVGFVSYGYVGGGIGRTMAGNVTDTLRTSRPRDQPVGFRRLHHRGPTAKHARNGVIVRWPYPHHIWVMYQTYDAAGARDVEARAQREGISAERYFAQHHLSLDVDNPNLQALSEPAATDGASGR
ncbi:MAG: DUF4347 domain-containing protein [Myxococcota bacterium]